MIGAIVDDGNIKDIAIIPIKEGGCEIGYGYI